MSLVRMQSEIDAANEELRRLLDACQRAHSSQAAIQLPPVRAGRRRDVAALGRLLAFAGPPAALGPAGAPVGGVGG